ncbi:MAG: sulfatase [Mariniblastus sp.]
MTVIDRARVFSSVIVFLPLLFLFASFGKTDEAVVATEENTASVAKASASETLPNFVVIFIDDLGYADIGPFGAKGYSTPNLDQMAKNGRKFTDFVVSSAVCSASRAALLTGCNHRRVGFAGAIGPTSKMGLSSDETTIAEICKQKGYATACFGKWHLGLQKKFLPLQHGFDQYFGLPYSNDMWPYHPAYVDLPADDPKRKRNYPPLPLIEGNEIVDAEVTGEDQTQLTTQYTEKAVQFIEDNVDKPFFLYVPHSMVHVPLYVSDKFKGKTDSLFGDVMMEVDWSVGEILKTLEKHDLDENTFVVFTSDNGPWLNYGKRAGSAAPLREGKGTMFEGGYRVPTVMQWPGKIPAGTTCDELASTIDILPTVAQWMGGKLPDHKIDGKDISRLVFGEKDAKSPHTHFPCYYKGGELQAIRDSQYKIVFPHRYRSLNGRVGNDDGKPIKYDQNKATFALYDLKSDVGETTDVAEQHPEVVARLMKYAEEVREDLGDKLTNKKGSGNREPGRVK